MQDWMAGPEPDNAFNAAVASARECRREVGARLRMHMKARGWRQRDLVEASGLRKDKVSGYVRGLHLPGYDTLAVLAGVFGIKVEELLPGIDERCAGRSMPAAYFKLTAVDGSDRMLVELRQELPTRLALELAAILEGQAGS